MECRDVTRCAQREIHLGFKLVALGLAPAPAEVTEGQRAVCGRVQGW